MGFVTDRQIYEIEFLKFKKRYSKPLVVLVPDIGLHHFQFKLFIFLHQFQVMDLNEVVIILHIPC